MFSSIARMIFERLKIEKTTFVGILFSNGSIFYPPFGALVLELGLQQEKRETHKVLVGDFPHIDFLFRLEDGIDCQCHQPSQHC